MKLSRYGKIFKVLLMSFVAIAGSKSGIAKEATLVVNVRDIQSGFVAKRIELTSYIKPAITITSVDYETAEHLPDNAFPSSPDRFDIILGMDRKQPFAVVKFPAYSMDDNGQLRQIKSIKFEYNEPALQNTIHSNNRSSAKGTAGGNSPLASGTWHKIAVPRTGLYKIDHSFLATQLGVSNISSSRIRLLGYGGKMLPERNTGIVQGLTETAIWVNDGGDGSFGPGDYFVFYGQGPVNWAPSADNKQLIQEKNFYEDKGYYFLNFDTDAEKRITTQQSVPNGNISVYNYSEVALHEQDLANPQKFGKLWWGEEFSSAPGKQNSHSITLELGNVTDSAEFNIHVVNTSSTRGLFDVYLNGQLIKNADVAPTNNYDYAPKAAGYMVNSKLPFNSSTATVRIDYTTAANDGSGWLDFIRINYRKPLSISSSSLVFRDLQSVGSGNIATYHVTNANGATQVWDVTDPQYPVLMKGSLNGNTYSFTQYADKLHTYAAMNNNNLDIPEYAGTIANQNLYGSGPVDYIIVTYPDFKPAAEKLAEFHRQRNGMKVMVATTTQVYNEFSSGGQDISAIRDLARMFYERAGMDEAKMPKYLLLMGDASYDYKNRISDNTNFAPTFEARESFEFLSTYSNDDFFGFLDEGEDIERYDIVNALDIGVGRIPAKSLQEANNVVNKIIHYKSPATLGAWRLSAMYIADDKDNAGDHLADAEVMNNVVTQNSNIHNASKVYLNAIPLISTPGGQRAPDANKVINDGIFKGLFLLNYSGHGNTSVLAHERIVTKDDYNKWRNIDRLPFMITATCDFGQFDQPSFVSSGEELMLKWNGGVIATLTTTHLVYAYANEMLNREFLSAQFQHINGKWNTFGDAMRIGKNSAYTGGVDAGVIENFRKFALLGDPALEPNFPEFFIHTESLKDGATGQPVSTISALGEYNIDGKVTDVNGNTLDYFNGTLSVTIFDKPRTVKTINGDERTFKVQNNTIYKGKATVNNGHFSFSFIAPKDLNYELGNGAISYYADNGQTDAAGRDTAITIGGFSDNPNLENNPPLVKAFIKDSLFKNGGLTGSNTALFAILEDETGINVSGNSVGHDLVAILDGDVSKPYNMNDYYETAPNTYKRGYLYFPVEGIPDGRHRFTIKAWDVNNNSGEGHVDFVVADGQVVKVQNLMNYPNPFRDLTHFVFEHNHPDENLTAEINIYNTAGVFVRKLTQDFISTGSRSNEITWDATDNNGAKLPAGIYIYRMMISTENGIETTAYQKLVLVR